MRYDVPTELRMLFHLTSSTSERRSYNVTSDLLSTSCGHAFSGEWGPDICDAIAYLDLYVETLEVTLRLIPPCVDVQLDARGQELVGP